MLRPSRNLVRCGLVDGFLFEEMHLGRIGFVALDEVCGMSLRKELLQPRDKERKQICGELTKVRSMLVVYHTSLSNVASAYCQIVARHGYSCSSVILKLCIIDD